MGCSVAGPDLSPLRDAVSAGPFGTLATARRPQALATAIGAEAEAWARGDRDPVVISSEWRHRLIPSASRAGSRPSSAPTPARRRCPAAGVREHAGTRRAGGRRPGGGHSAPRPGAVGGSALARSPGSAASCARAGQRAGVVGRDQRPGSPTTSSSEPVLRPAPAARRPSPRRPRSRTARARWPAARWPARTRRSRRAARAPRRRARRREAHALAHAERCRPSLGAGPRSGPLPRASTARRRSRSRRRRSATTRSSTPFSRHEAADAQDPQRLRPPRRHRCAGREALDVDAHRKDLDALRRHARELEMQPGTSLIAMRRRALRPPRARGEPPRVGRGRQRDVLPDRRHDAAAGSGAAGPDRLQRVGVGQLGDVSDVEPAQGALEPER